jgi:GNAT superfamily N-acetyltransferase
MLRADENSGSQTCGCEHHRRVQSQPRVGNREGTYFVAEHNGAVIGQLLITYEWSDWRNGNFWWIQSVYVAQEFRENGVFRGLFSHVEKLARSRRDVCGLRLYVEKNNRRAHQAYARLGMKHTHYEIYETCFR